MSSTRTVVVYNAAARYKDCGYAYAEGGIFPLSIAHSPTATYIPTIHAGDDGYPMWHAYLAHHIAQQTEHTDSTKEFFVELLNSGCLIFRQPPDANSPTDPASRRFGNGIHTYRTNKYGRKSICLDNEQNRKLIDSLLNAILKYGAEVLLVPEDNLVLTRFDARGYEIGGYIGDHDDTPNSTDSKYVRVRLCIKLGAQTKVVFSLYQYNPDTDKQPLVFRGVPSIELICPHGFSVYSTTAFASGHIPLAVNGDSGDGTFIIPQHRVEKVEDGKAITIVIDYWFNSVKSAMYAQEKIRKNTFHLDFNGTEYVDKYYNVSDTSCCLNHLMKL